MIGRMRGLLRALGWGAVLAATAGIAAHYSGLVSNLASRLAAFTPVLIIVGVVGLLLLLAARAWLSAAGAVLVIAVGVTAQAPLYRGADEQVSDSDLTVMQANIYLGQADPDALVSRVRDSGVDVLTVVELTSEAVGALERAGLRQALPFVFLRPRDGGGGAGIYARAPADRRATLAWVRIVESSCATASSEPHAHLDLCTAPIAAVSRTVVALGCRAPRVALDPLRRHRSTDHRRRCELDLRSPLLPAATVGTAGFAPADRRRRASRIGRRRDYPAGRPYPSLLALDRVLTRNGPTPTSFRRIDLPGSDHHGVLASIRLSEG